MVPLTREKRPDEKKLEMIGRGNRKKLTDERKKKKKKCHKFPQPARQRKEKENERNKEKKMEKKEIYKGRNTHSPLPHCTRIIEHKKKKIF